MVKQKANSVPTTIAPKKQRIRELVKKPKEKFLTKNQEEYYKVLDENQITLCIGPAGTGKSFLSLRKAVDLIWNDNNKYEKITIVRPTVTAGKDLGSTPGDVDEKLFPYMYPSFYLLEKIVGREGLEALKKEGFIESLAISFCRGLNIDNSILILEESQNTTPEEMLLVLTRIGYNSKFFISGDLNQSDKYRDKTKSGLFDAKERLNGMKDVGFFEFTAEDNVRNPIITEILERYKL